MNFKIGDKVKYIGKLYSFKNPQGIIKDIRGGEINRPIEVLFEGYKENIYCYESELLQTTLSFETIELFINSVKARKDITSVYPYIVGYFESLIQHLYYIGDDEIKDEIKRSLEKL